MNIDYKNDYAISMGYNSWDDALSDMGIIKMSYSPEMINNYIVILDEFISGYVLYLENIKAIEHKKLGLDILSNDDIKFINNLVEKSKKTNLK